MGGVEKRSSTPNGHLARFGCHDVEMKEVGWLVGRFRGADFVCSPMFAGCSHGVLRIHISSVGRAFDQDVVASVV